MYRKPKLVLLFLIPRGRLRWLGCYQIWLVCVTRRDQDQLLPGIGILGIFPLAAQTSFEVNASTNSKSRPITENTAEGARFGRGIHPIMPIHSIRSDARAVEYSLGVSAATNRAIGPTLIDAFEAFAQGNTNRKKKPRRYDACWLSAMGSASSTKSNRIGRSLYLIG